MTPTKSTLLFFLLLASACPPSIRAGEDPSSASNATDPKNAEEIVSRYQCVWTAPPKKVPSNRNSDAPLLGNGDIGVLIGGAPEKQQFFISKCDFWRPQPYFWWFTPALVGAFDLEIPALEGASYKAVQDIAKAEVRQTFTHPGGTVELRSWTPATGHELIVEISCTGKPVEIKASPWTYFGNGATVENGRNDGVSWLTRSFTGPGYDWDSQATLAVSMEGSTPLEKNGDLGNPTQPPTSRSDVATTKIPAGKVPVTIGGRLVRNKQKGQFSNPFKGQIHGVGLYDRVLTEKEIAQLQKGQVLGDKPVFVSGDIGASTGDPGNPDGVSIGEAIIPSKSYTLILDVTPELAAGRILAFGEPGNGIEVSQDPHGGGGYFLTVKAAGHLVSSLDNLPARKRITAAITFDGSALLLCANGKTSGTRRIDATPRILTLQPGKPVRLVAAARTNQERPDFQADAIKGAKSLDAGAVARLQEEHLRWWRSFWSESFVEISDPVLEGYYYGSFYIMACCSRNKEFAAPLFGNWASGDIPAMGGDYHMNYNYSAPWWGCYGANHIGLTDPFDTPMLQYVERGKYMAKNYLGRKGIYFCAGIGPKGSCACWEHPHDGWKEDSAKKHYFAGQKCDALFGGINMAMRWNSTLDPVYARKVYPYLRELAAFWEDDLVWESAPYEVDRNNLYDLNPAPGREGVIRKEGRYSILHDNLHEGGPAKEGDKNNPMSLSFLRSCLKATLEMSRELGVDADKREKWQHILDHLSGYTIFDREGKKIFRYSEEGRDFDLRAGTCGLMHLYPGDAIGLECSPEMLEISRNSIEQHPTEWKSRNTTMSFYPAMARIGYPPQAILEGLHALIDECGFPNYVIDRGGGGGIETCSTVTTTINEMLLQSLQGVIRLFPNWPKEKDARFDKLRAYGAFLVSAEQKGGTVQNVRLRSERGQPCTLRNPWPGKKIELVRNGKPGEELVGDLVKFTTTPGETFELKPK